MIQPNKITTEEIAALQVAYKRAIYEVYWGDRVIQVHIDRRCPKLDALMIRQGYSCWALITAYNPYSQCLSAQVNQQRHRELIEYLVELQLAYLPAVGRDVDNIWTPEQSLCIFDLQLQQAIAIGQKFNQNAIVYGKSNQPVELQWL